MMKPRLLPNSASSVSFNKVHGSVITDKDTGYQIMTYSSTKD